MKRLAPALLAALVVAGITWGQDGRVPNELSLFTRLNGVPTRFWMSDGGPSRITATVGPACIPSAFRDVYLVTGCTVDVNVCAVSFDGGGCTPVIEDFNYGVPVAAGIGERYIVQDRNATPRLCAVARDGGAFNCPVFQLR